MQTLRAYEADRGYIKSICYKMLGDIEEAAEVTQEVFCRALEGGIKDEERVWRPWLSRVAVHLSIDALRRRQRRGYAGCWLPTPVGEGGGEWLWEAGRAGDGEDGEVLYGRVESATLGFLYALEALSAEQRAVLVLRDVVGVSGAEVAALLGLTEVHVRVLHHRAKGKMRGYDEGRSRPTEAAKREAALRMMEVLEAVGRGDVEAVARVMMGDVRMYQDGGGEVKAAQRVIVGAQAVARFFVGVVRKEGGPRVSEMRWVEVNGWPGLLTRMEGGGERVAERSLLQLEVGEGGLVRRIWGVMAPKKLGGMV